MRIRTNRKVTRSLDPTTLKLDGNLVEKVSRIVSQSRNNTERSERYYDTGDFIEQTLLDAVTKYEEQHGEVPVTLSGVVTNTDS